MIGQLAPVTGHMIIINLAHYVDVIKVHAHVSEVMQHDFNLPGIVENSRLSTDKS
jgi:hypothetical protein